ncbi:hypothetical protein ACFDAU_01435 [Sulfuriferula sp. GW1]|uniref:hypothetical protein n=1 Tax=Sulfuriferula sp. GW1 TaxID=3345111 RepID=UPI0039AF266B
MDSENIKKLRKAKTLEFVGLVESHTKITSGIELEEKLDIGGDGRVWRSFKQVKGKGSRSMSFSELRETTKLALESNCISKAGAERLLDKLSLEIEAAKRAEYEDENYVYGSGVPSREELVERFQLEAESNWGGLIPEAVIQKSFGVGHGLPIKDGCTTSREYALKMVALREKALASCYRE